QRLVAHEFVDLLDTGVATQLEIQDRHGDVGGRHPDGVAGELAGQLRDRLRHRLGGAGLGEHHVEGRAAAAAVALVVVVDEVLVVGVGVHRLHMALDDAVVVEQHLQHRHDGVGGTGGGGDDGLVGGDVPVVHAVDDIGDVALARGGEQHL